MKKIIKNAAINALSTSLYIAAIASFLFYASKLFGPNESDTVLIPIVMLSLLVFSVAITGLLIFGRPILWYLDGRKREAVFLLAYTLGIFLIITVAAVLTLYLTS